MHKLSFMMVGAILAAAMPMTAEAAVPTAPCAQSSEYGNVGLAGAHEDVTPALIPDPAIHGDPFSATDYPEESVVRFKYRIDVSGSAENPSALTADVRIALRWDNGVSDYDLYVYDANGELLAGNNGGLGNLNNGDLLNGDVSGLEKQFLPHMPHCTDLRVDVVNYEGLPPSEMTLDTTLGELE